MNAKLRDFTPEQEERLKQEAARRVNNALVNIERAQQHMTVATVALSAIDGGCEAWIKAGRATAETEQLIKLVQTLRQIRKFTLDSFHGQDFLAIQTVRAKLKEPDR